MKSYKLTGLEKFSLVDAPKPKVQHSTDVLVRVRRVGICGSDVHYYADGKIGSQIVEYPWSVGHEASGTVEAVGSDVGGIRVGQQIAFDPAMPCYRCQQCLSGRPHTCLNLKFLGCPQQIEGCLSEYFVLPETSCLTLPVNMPLEEAAIVEPLSIAVYGASLFPSLKGADVAIFGAGPIGLCLLQVAKHAGAASVFIVDKIDERLAAASVFGADWTGNVLMQDIVNDIQNAKPNGLDVVFECCGQQLALDQSLKILKPGGELSIIGIPEPNRVSFDINLLRRKEIRVQNVRRQNGCMKRSIELIESGAVDAKSLISHRFSFDETPFAFDLVKNYRDGVIKSMISLD